MSTLKQLRLRISGVKSTEKITKAMKMVSASKLAKAQEAKDSLKPYADKMYNVVSGLAGSISEEIDVSPLLVGNGKDNIHLIVVISSDRGLCGGFNSSIVKAVKQHMNSPNLRGKEFKQLKLFYENQIIEVISGFSKDTYKEAYALSTRIMDLFKNNEFDTCTFVYTEYKNALKQNTCIRKIIPLNEDLSQHSAHDSDVYEYEPSESYMLDFILPLNLSVQIYYMILETIASEHGARMTAMDSASKNAQEMIADLTLLYNRSRQAAITSELIEIISSAEII
jgi:F-type H+-transporting ATPase subunit gamma